MDDNKKKIMIGVGAGLVVLAVLIWALTSGGDETGTVAGGAPAGANLVCDKGHKFIVSIDDMASHNREHYGQPYPCPECGSTKTQPSPEVGGRRR